MSRLLGARRRQSKRPLRPESPRHSRFTQLAEETLSRLRCRRRAGGLAAAEAVIIIGLMVIVLLSSMWIHSVYLNKHLAMLEARHDAWSASLQGCGWGYENAKDTLFTESVQTEPIADEDQELPADGSNLPQFQLDDSGGARVHAVPGSHLYGSRQISASLTVVCNEAGGRSSGLDSIGDYITDLFSSGSKDADQASQDVWNEEAQAIDNPNQNCGDDNNMTAGCGGCSVTLAREVPKSRWGFLCVCIALALARRRGFAISLAKARWRGLGRGEYRQ